MKKNNYLSVSWSILSTVLIFVFVLAPLGVFGASTIGTNVSTTGTFLVNPAADSATSVRFQNAAGSNYFVADSTNARIGVGAAPSTTFEVQGTASASYFLTSNTIQVGSAFASVAYSRFGAGSTGHSLAAAQDVLFSGLTEFDGNAFFDAKVGVGGATNTVFEVQGTASASYFLTGNTIQVGGYASVAYSRFGVSAATSHSSYVTTTSDVLINGDLEVDGKAFFDGTASVATDFEVVGYASAGNAFVARNLVVGLNVASSSTAYVAEFVSTATTSVLFGGSSATLGTCLQFKNTEGQTVYARIFGTTWTVNANECR